MIRDRTLWLATGAAAALLGATAAWGHGLDAASLTLREVRAGVFDVQWRASALRLPGANVQPVLPERCHRIGSATANDAGDRIALDWTIDCGDAGLGGSVVAVDDLGAAKINALLTIEPLQGEKLQRILSPRSPALVIPVQPTAAQIVDRYLELGAARLFGSPDHLLCVVGLVLLVSMSRRLWQTIAAFTLGHSLTLAAAALGIVPAQSRAGAILIALTVLVLAVELARDTARPTLARRWPWALAATFGALHGVGFASDFAAAGAPAGQFALALMTFNAGIELAETALVGAVLITGAVLWRWLPAVAPRATRVAVYAMGILSVMWCFQRAVVWLG